MAMNPELSQLFELGISEKLQLVEDLWDNIASDADAVPVPDWQKEELARRKAEHVQNPDAGASWEEVKQRIRSRDA